MATVITDTKLDFKDVMLVPTESVLRSRSEVSLVRNYEFKHSSVKWSGVGIIAANMDTVGTFSMARSLTPRNMLTAIHKHYPREKLIEFFLKDEASTNAFFTIGTSEDDLEVLKYVLKKIGSEKLKFICIDIANGYSRHLQKTIQSVRSMLPKSCLMVGNVVTPEMVNRFHSLGVDIVKIGIGSGSVCTTRKMTGIGYPQFSAILECGAIAKELGIHICSDGGCTTPGDIAKAFAAGSSFVMLGGMLAAHTESETEQMTEKDVSFYGMSSRTAMKKYNGGVATYRTSEGKEVSIPYRGPVSNTLEEIEGGLRSACTYTNSRTLQELSENPIFIKVNNQLNTVFS